VKIQGRRKSPVGVVILAGSMALVTLGAAPSGPLRTVDSAALGLSFSYPAGFQVGRYKEEVLPQKVKDAGIESPFKNAIVLVEPGQLGKYVAEAIPLGAVPTISVDLRTGFKAKILRDDFCKDEYKVTLGKRLAYRLPGAPGPYGDQAFYYLVPAAAGSLVEIEAHRLYFSDQVKTASGGHAETHYDRVIETIIKSLKLRGE